MGGKTRAAVDPAGGPAPPADRWRRAEAALVARLASVSEEISSYPAPIPACDAQFNFLLEQRSRIPAELARLRALRGEPGAADEFARRLDAFIAGCPYLDAAALTDGALAAAGTEGENAPAPVARREGRD